MNRLWIWLGLPHWYLSTGCLHGGDGHAYCQGLTGRAGTKAPGRCKHCNARCRCRCHRNPPSLPPPSLTVVVPPKVRAGGPAHQPVRLRGVCCDLHGIYCEPPGDLCCRACPEADHPNHPQGASCVLDEQ